MLVVLAGILFIPVVLYTVAVSSGFLLHQTFFSFSLASLAPGHLLFAHAFFLGLAALTFATTSSLLFIVRNRQLVIGSKKTLLVIAALTLLCGVVLAYKLAVAARPFMEARVEANITSTRP